MKIKHWEILPLNPYLLRCDGKVVMEGTWSDCRRHALIHAHPADVITSGIASVRVPAWMERGEYNEKAKACGMLDLIIPLTHND